jgi:hypothetical protein
MSENLISNDDSMDNVKDMVDLPANRYSIEHDHSVLKYRAMTDADYGYLFCWAENAVGEQVRKPINQGNRTGELSAYD